MKKEFITMDVGSKKHHEPPLLGDLLSEILQHSDSPLAIAYRKHLANKDNAEKGDNYE